MVATLGTLGSFSTVAGYGGPRLDPGGPAMVAPGGVNSALNVTAAQVIKATPGRLIKVLVVIAGSGGNLVLNDTTTTGAAATANEILTIANSSLTVGQVLSLDWPCANGIVISAVTTGGQFSISYD